MNSPFDRWLHQDWRAMSPEERGPSYHDLYKAIDHRAGAVNQLQPMMNELYRAQRSGPDGYDGRIRCQWCGGHVRNVTSCPNCGGPP